MIRFVALPIVSIVIFLAIFIFLRFSGWWSRFVRVNAVATLIECISY